MITTSTNTEQGRNMENIRNIIDAANGKFFSVRFMKKDGTVRDMVCRTGVKKHLKGGSDTLAGKDNIVKVYDVQAKGYRCFDVSRVIAIRAQKKTTVFTLEA